MKSFETIDLKIRPQSIKSIVVPAKNCIRFNSKISPNKRKKQHKYLWRLFYPHWKDLQIPLWNHHVSCCQQQRQFPIFHMYKRHVLYHASTRICHEQYMYHSTIHLNQIHGIDTKRTDYTRYFSCKINTSKLTGESITNGANTFKLLHSRLFATRTPFRLNLDTRLSIWETAEYRAQVDRSNFWLALKASKEGIALILDSQLSIDFR